MPDREMPCLHQHHIVRW